ncbi:unnamed protein product [Sympodiomycopsis kandeliae]
MRLDLHNINTATAMLLGSLCLLLATILAHQAKAHDVPEHTVNRRSLGYQKRASGGPAWHEHPMWNHPALYEGAKLWPSSSESSSKSSTHSSGHSVENTGSKPSDEVTSHLDKGKGVATGSSAGVGGGHTVPTQGQAARGGRIFKNTSKMGRPLGKKDSKPRAPFKQSGYRDPSTYRGGRPLGAKDKTPRGPRKGKEPSGRGAGRPVGSKDKKLRKQRVPYQKPKDLETSSSS